jgi:hypothetical protein
VQRQAAALEVIHDAARRADHDMRAMFETGGLRTHRRAAAQRQHLDVFFSTRETADFLRDLIGEFARGAQHHCLHGEVAHVEPRQQRQRKRRGLAAAGFRLRDQIVTGQCDRQAGGLDRRHLEITELRQIGQCGRRERKLAERRASRGGTIHIDGSLRTHWKGRPSICS